MADRRNCGCCLALISGVGLENKHTMAVFGFAVVAGFSLSGDLRPFRSRWIWIGGLIALAIAFPNLLWEARHGWPQIEVVRNAQQFKNVRDWAAAISWRAGAVLSPVTLPLWLGGLGLAVLRARGEAVPVSRLGLIVVVLAIFIFGDGKTYYPMGAYPMLMAAGGVAFEGFASQRALEERFESLIPR